MDPDSSVRIELCYLQEIGLTLNTFYQLHMVATISPRYMNYIPGEVVKAGLRSDGARSKGEFYWNFRISLKTSKKTIFFDSHSHDVELVSQNEGKTISEIVMSK